MPFRTPGAYRKKWGSDFGFEPLNVHADKEVQRATDLVSAASRQKFGTDTPPTPNFLSAMTNIVRGAASAFGSAQQAAATRPRSFEGRPTDTGGSDRSARTLAGETFQQTFQRKAREARASEPSSSLLGVPGLGTSLGDAAHALNTLTSGHAFVKDLTKGRVDTNDLPGPLATIADVGLAPATLATAGFGGAANAAGRGGGRVLAGSILKQAARETAAGTVGVMAGQKAAEALPEGTPGLVRAGVGLGVGVLAGGAAYHPKSALRRFGPLKGLSIEDASAVPQRIGKTVEVQSSLNPETKYGFRYRVIDLGDAVASHDPVTFNPNPAYEKVIQPRDRGSAASRIQVEQQAKNLDPAKLLAETGDLQNGVPIIGPDGLVESGNGRTMATAIAAKEHPERYAAYVDQLKSKLGDYGLTDKALEGVKQPYLVRERITPVDRPAFASEANASSTLRMGTTETAAADSKLISDELLHNLDIPEGATLDQVLTSGQASTFRRHWMGQLSDTERGAMIDTKGELSAAGLQRLKAAFFAKTYPGEAGQRLLANFFENADPSVRNVRNGMEQSLPAVARLEAGVRAGRIAPELSIADEVAAAADAFQRIKSGTLKFKSVNDYLSQGAMFGDEMNLSPVAKDILKFMDENSRAPKQLREALRNYSEDAMAAPPPGQAGMFGGDMAAPASDAKGIWERATGRVVPEETVSEPGLAMGSGRVNFPEPTAETTSSTLPESKAPTTTNEAKVNSESSTPADANVLVNSDSPTPNIEVQPKSANAELPSETSVGSKSMPESVPPKTNTTEKVMGRVMQLADEKPGADGVTYQLFAPADGSTVGITRAVDESGGVVGIQQYAKFEDAQAAHNEALGVSSKAVAQQPDTRPGPAAPLPPELAQGSTVRLKNGTTGIITGVDNYGNWVVNGRRSILESDIAEIVGEARRKAAVPTTPEVTVASPQSSRFWMPMGTEMSDPRYSYRDKQFTVHFEDDLDRALYIVAQEKRSKADETIMRSLRVYFGDKPDAEIRQLGGTVRSRIKALAVDSPRGQTLNVTPGVHELGVAEGLPVPRPFPYETKNADGTVSQSGPPRQDPRRAVHQPLPSGPGDAVAPRSAPVAGRIEPGQQMAPGARGAEAVFGEPSGVNTPASSPPAPPAKPPTPSEPGPGNPQRALGQDGPTVDLLGARDRQQLVDAATAGQQTRTGKFKQRVVKRDARVEAVRSEKLRTDHIVTELPNEWADTLRRDAEKAGLDLEPNATGWVLKTKDGESVSVSDLVEGRGDAAVAADSTLTSEQRAVLTEVQRRNDLVNKTAEAYGVEIPKVDTETGSFWPRKVIARIVEGKTIPKDEAGAGTTRRLGANRIGTRTQASEAIGAEGGVVYDNPWDALRDSWKNKLMMAQDGKLQQLIEPLAVDEAKSGFGYSSLPGHPALSKKAVIGTSEGGAAIMVDKPMQFETPVRDQLRDIFESRSIADTKPGRVMQGINSVATATRASMDLSSRLNQGLGFLESSPANAAKAVKGSIAVIKSTLGNPEAYAALRRTEAERTAALLAKAGVNEADQAGWLVRMGKHYAGEGATQEFQFPQFFENSVGKVPLIGKALEKGVRWSNEDFGRYTNYARDVLSNDALERAVGTGLKGQALETEMEGALKSVNRMTGWTVTKPSGLESMALFAPRFFRSNLEQIAAAVTGSGMEKSIARAHLLKLLGTGAALVYGINSVRGYDTVLDPRSSNFMRIRNIGGMDVSPAGPFATFIRGVAQTVAGQAGETPSSDLSAALQFGRAKSSPVLGTLWSLVTGSNFNGEKFDPSSPAGLPGALAKVAKESLPFSAQALIDQGPLAAAASSLGAQSSQITPAEKRNFERDKVAKRLFNGSDYASLSGGDKATVNQDPKVAALAKSAQNNALTRGGDQAASTSFNQEFAKKVGESAKFLAAGKDAAGNPFTGIDYRKAYQDAGKTRRDELKGAGASGGGDATLDGYYALYDQADMGNGQTDYDKLDQLQADYVAKHPDVTAKLAKSIGANDDPTAKRLRAAQTQANAYYSLPQYKGLTVEQGKRAATALSQASTLTTAKVVPTRDSAFKQLISEGKITQEDALLAIRASRLGTSPERQAFLASNPEFAVFYRGAPGDGSTAGQSVSSSSSSKKNPVKLRSRTTKSGLRR